MTKHVYIITGPRGSGKSTAIATYPKPSELGKTCIIDTEDSFSDIIDKFKGLGLEFGKYVRMYDRFAVKEDMLARIAKGQLPWVSSKQKGALVEYYEFFLSTLDNTLKNGNFKYLGIDTIEPIEAAMTAWAETNRQASGWSGSKAYGKLETEAVRPLYDNLLESIHRRGVEVILMSSHLKKIWENERPVPNKLAPGGRLSVLSRISSGMYWLIPNVGNKDGSPAAVVLKARSAMVSVEGDEWVIQKPLPARIPSFNWRNVREYEKNGCDLLNPEPGETLTDDEMEMISEFLSDAQMRLMVLGAEKELEEIKIASATPSFYESKEETDGVRDRVLALLGEGKSKPQVAQELGMPLPRVIKLSMESRDGGGEG